MFTLADVVHLFPDEFTSLSAGRFSFPGILMRALKRLFLRHKSALVSPLSSLQNTDIGFRGCIEYCM
jgi:hypothetical protein